MCKMLTVESRKLLYNASVASRLNYCDVIWDMCNVNSSNKIQTIQNRCARRILDAAPGTSARPLIHELGWLTLNKKRKLHKCVLFYDLLQGKGPQLLCDGLSAYKRQGPQQTRGTANECLFLPTHRTNYIAKSFYHDAAKLWNSIPLSIRNAKSRATFKERLHKHYFLNE